MRLFVNSARMAAKIVALVALLGVVYGLVADRALVYTYAVNLGLAVSVVILISGLVRLFVPTALLVKKGLLVDHTTYGEKFKEAGEHKHLQAYELIYTGIAGISITAIAQFLLHFVF